MQINNLASPSEEMRDPQHGHTSATTKTKMSVPLIEFSFELNVMPLVMSNVGVRKLSLGALNSQPSFRSSG